jgi:hypothetical protein
MFKSAGPTGFGYGSTAEQVTEGLSLASQTILVTGCMRIAHAHADRLFAVVSQGGACHHMFDSAWIEAQNQMEYPFALGDALAYKFGFRGGDPLKAYAADARKFSLLESGVLDRPSCRLLVINGMEDSILPIEDSFIVGIRGDKKDLLARGNRQHMGNPGAEDILYDWIDKAVAGKP